MAITRRRYTAEFKREAVRLSQQREVSRLQVARELGVHPRACWASGSGSLLRAVGRVSLERRLNRSPRRSLSGCGGS